MTHLERTAADLARRGLLPHGDRRERLLADARELAAVVFERYRIREGRKPSERVAGNRC